MLEKNMRNVGYMTSVIGLILLVISFYLPEGTSTQTSIICGVLFIIGTFITECLRYIYIAIDELSHSLKKKNQKSKSKDNNE